MSPVNKSCVKNAHAVATMSFGVTRSPSISAESGGSRTSKWPLSSTTALLRGVTIWSDNQDQQRNPFFFCVIFLPFPNHCEATHRRQPEAGLGLSCCHPTFASKSDRGTWATSMAGVTRRPLGLVQVRLIVPFACHPTGKGSVSCQPHLGRASIAWRVGRG